MRLWGWIRARSKELHCDYSQLFRVIQIEQQFDWPLTPTYTHLFTTNHSRQRRQTLSAVEQKASALIGTFLLTDSKILKRDCLVGFPQ